jgi:CRP-like cAMP-binding protein
MWVRGKQSSNFVRTSTCLSKGDVADTVFYIQKGKVKLTVLSDQGKEAVVAILEPGQFFAEAHEEHFDVLREQDGRTRRSSNAIRFSQMTEVRFGSS